MAQTGLDGLLDVDTVADEALDAAWSYWTRATMPPQGSWPGGP